MSPSPKAAPRRGLAIAALVGTTLCWGANYIVGEAAVRTVDPLSLTFLRWGIAAPILLVLAALVERPDWRAAARALPRLALLGALGMIGFGLPIYVALQHTTAVSASIISSVCPVLIAVVAAAVLRERLSWPLVAGLAIGLVGVLLVVSKGSVEAVLSLDLNVGDLWVLLAVVCWTAYTVYGRRLSDVPPMTSVGLQAAIVTVLMAPFVAVLGLHVPPTLEAWGSVVFLALLPSFVAYLLWNIALRTIPASSAGTYLNLIPVTVVVIAFAIGGEITVADLAGGALVLGGVLLATVRFRSSRGAGAPR